MKKPSIMSKPIWQGHTYFNLWNLALMITFSCSAIEVGKRADVLGLLIIYAVYIIGAVAALFTHNQYIDATEEHVQRSSCELGLDD